MSTLLDQASLVLIPSGYKEDIVYSQKPTDGSGDLTFTRASDGTRVNSSGLVENVPWNLIQQSSVFNVSPWAFTGGVTLTGGFTDASGGTNAFRFQATSGSYKYGYQTISSTIGQVYTHSIYAKCSTGTQQFKLTDAQQGGGSLQTVTTEWQRFTFTLTATSGNIAIELGSDGTNALDIYICFSQTNIGSTAKPYFPTTDRQNVPRLTYEGGCPSLLLEPQRTNIAIYSEQFDNPAGWTLYNGTQVANTTETLDPSGYYGAEKVIMGGTNSATYRKVIGGLTNGDTYTFSLYIKQGSGVTAFLDISDTSVTPDITPTSEWVRYTKTGVWNTSLNFVDIELRGTSGSYCYIWGAQLEQGSYATSYIPTTSASVTRVADVAYKTGISSLIGQTEGVVFLDFEINNLSEANGEKVLCYMRSGGTGERFITVINDTRLVYVESNGSTIAVITKTGLSIGRHKCAIAYATNDFVFYVDGVQIGTDTSGTPSGFSEFGLQYYVAAYAGSQNVNQAVIFPTRLSNTELAALTTL